MGRIVADNSNLQVVNFTDLILQINYFIVQNYAAISGLVEQLDNIMDPYKDKQYISELKEMMKTDSVDAKTPNQLKQIQLSIERDLVKRKHRALMRLAYRKRFLPSAACGKDDIFAEEQPNVMEANNELQY
ncbi:hypothetical protein V7O67_05115 [Methanolobus sp. ZRKC4]|uniref:hypothetical protein n=1 Tax=Methanolobus sp. ZRKC4 TaxID=3125787 RepID=UPI0032475EAF